MKSRFLLTVIVVFGLLSCGSGKTINPEIAFQPMAERQILFTPGPQTLVYKTTKDYSDLVPVIMDKRKTRIVSYPAPSDVFRNGKLAKPTMLKYGYLLDNRGIGPDVAFLKYSYEEYSKFQEVPAMQVLLENIEDKWPLIELIDCGIRTQYSDEVKELNVIIDSNFKGCKRFDIEVVPMVIKDAE